MSAPLQNLSTSPIAPVTETSVGASTGRRCQDRDWLARRIGELGDVGQKVGGNRVFRFMIGGSEQVRELAKNYHFWNKGIFSDASFPCMYFIEHRYADDPTNWWIPNRAAAEAMLRSSGLEIVAHPEPETWLCVPRNSVRQGQYILDLELAGTL